MLILQSVHVFLKSVLATVAVTECTHCAVRLILTASVMLCVSSDSTSSVQV